MAQNLNFAPVGAVSLFAGARLRGMASLPAAIALMAVTDPLLGGYCVFDAVRVCEFPDQCLDRHAAAAHRNPAVDRFSGAD